MVQRKVKGKKLGIPADVKTKDLKPPPFQHHEGADLAKKMKHGDMERLSAGPSRSLRTLLPSLQKKAAAERSPDAAPNYMKSTSSSDARKERLRVSPRSLRSLFQSEESDGNPSSGSVPKAARRASSNLKPVRTLTKTTSFKPARASARRCSSPEAQAQRATCSSTLRDSMFPAYLELSPGGTESAIKVCPFTYCSLNGHHRSPSPPLKSFVCARRRMLKAQRVPNATGDQQSKSDEPSPDQECEMPIDFSLQIYTKGTTDIPASFSPVEETAGGDVKSRGLENLQAGKLPSSELDLIANSRPTKLEDHKVDSIRGEGECDEVEGREIIPMGSELFDMDWEADTYCVSMQDFDLEFDSWIFPSKSMDDAQEQVFDVESVSSKGDTCQNFEIHEGPDLFWGTQHPCPPCNNILEDDDPAEEIWDPKSQDFHSESEEMNDNCSPMEANSEFEDEEDDVSSKQETCTSMLDVAGATSDHNHPGHLSVNGQSDEQFAGEEFNLKWKTGSKVSLQEYEVPKDFNPRRPNFLPVEPAPDAEKVDLKHQTMDDNKNTDEWMLDYAIQQAVTKLAPARNKRVALLVEAFETVLPLPRFKPQQRHATPAFPHAPIIQACS